MKNQIVTAFEKRVFAGKTPDLPEFRPGDTVKVHYRISEGKKTRVQPFEGVVIRFKKGTAEGSFTVRKVGANSIGVERVFPLYSPNIEKLEVRQKGIVRRSRLYYLRSLSGKAARIRSKFGANLKPAATKKAAPAESKSEDKPSS